LADAGGGERAVHHLERAEEMVVRTTSLIGDLLNFGVVSAGPEPVAVRTIIQEALDELEPEVAACRAAVEVGDMPTLLADRTKLRQLFVNLFANALKYGRDGARPEITVRSEPEADDAWRFSVSDNGTGMEPGDLERVFGLFQRGSDSGRLAGSGLGLALCRQIVEGHGGRIWAESQPGAGTTIRFTLPGGIAVPTAVTAGVAELVASDDPVPAPSEAERIG
jgi:signal transduction histidine kinase